MITNKLFILAVVLFTALNIAKGEEVIRVGIYSSEEKIISENNIKFIDNKKAQAFEKLVNKLQNGKINFKWDRRGYYIIIFNDDIIRGYEFKPWTSGTELTLLPLEFERLEHNKLKFKKYIIEEGFQAPRIKKALLEKFFPPLVSK